MQPAAMDLVLMGILLISALVGLIRGLIREALSLAVWIGAVWVAASYGDDVAPLFARTFEEPMLRLWVARAAVFVAVLFAGSFLVWIVGYLVRDSIITGTDRVLGLLFGLARGVVVVALLVLALELFGLSAEPWWQQSKLVPYAARAGQELRKLAGRELDGFSR